MCKYFTNEQITTVINMGMSIVAAMFIGILLRILGLPCWLVCGSVAVASVIIEHFLTIYPLFVLKYIRKVSEEKGKKCKK